MPLIAPWTAFTGKYRLHRWPWRELRGAIDALRSRNFDFGVSGRRDPRDHLMLALAGARQRLGFPRAGSTLLLTTRLQPPSQPHRSDYWQALASALGWSLATPEDRSERGRRIVIHPGAGHPVRIWPIERFRDLGQRLSSEGWHVEWADPDSNNMDSLFAQLSRADRFIGNDSGPGHIAALLGIPTFTIFGPQRPDLFAPRHPRSAWIEGMPCSYRPCFDRCRFVEPFCIRDLTLNAVWPKVAAWLGT